MNTYSEWYNSLSRIIANHYAHCSRDELAEACFRAGHEAGKSLPMPPAEQPDRNPEAPSAEISPGIV